MSRQVLFTLLVVAVLVGLWFGLWSTWKTDLLHSEEYRLDPARFHLPRRPVWVPETLVHDVLLSAGLNRLESVLDAKLPEKLSAAFSLNPWVRKVRKVQIKYPAEVYVDLDYRRPVCLVQLPDDSGFYPVDSEGILLPTDYFTRGSPQEIAEKMSELLLVVGAPSSPIGSFGDTWGESSVEKAAQLADLLGEDAKLWGIDTLRIITDPKANSLALSWEVQPPKYRLITGNGRTVEWGTYDFAPGSPKVPSLKEEAKKEKLRKRILLFGSLANLPEEQSRLDETD